MADKWASPQAEEKAGELGIALADVEGTGKDGAATVQDVEAASEPQSSPAGDAPAEPVAEEEKMILAELNPKLGDLDKLVLYDSEGNAHTLVGSNPSTRIMSESLFGDLSREKHPPTPAHPNGFKYLIKGREVG